eukprot:3774172-Rhodomonas_salina.7
MTRQILSTEQGELHVKAEDGVEPGRAGKRLRESTSAWRLVSSSFQGKSRCESCRPACEQRSHESACRIHTLKHAGMS